MIINESFSLLYPSEESEAAHENGSLVPRISEEVAEQLGLLKYINPRARSLSTFLSCDPETIVFRQNIFADLIENPKLGQALVSAFPILNDIIELRQLESRKEESTESYLTSITEIELYVSCVEKLRDGLCDQRENVRSASIKRLIDTVMTLTESDYYKELNEKLNELTGRVREVRSVTIGVNLDGQLRPVDGGVLSVNPKEFKSGDILEKVLRFNFKNDEYTCIAPLVPFERSSSENRQTALTSAFNSAINDVMKGSIKGWRKIVNEYVLENTDFLLRIMPEIEFLVKASGFIRELTDVGMKVVFPKIMPTTARAFKATGLYNPDVALRTSTAIVKNDFTFDTNGEIFVLTGPNRGGKSVITCAVGITQIMAQLGMPVPADSLEISPVDAMFTHFPAGSEDTIDRGRLGEECSRLGEILDRADSGTMILLDESLSSTGAYEASFIAAEILASFAVMGCRGIFSTHLHELAAHIDEVNGRVSEFGGSPIDSLVAEITDGERSFRIIRRKPDGKSYARDISEKYGLSFEKILNKRNSSEGDK